MMLVSYTIVDFYKFYDGVYDMQIDPFWQKVSLESFIQVTVEACEPLV